ncbi:MAG: hypothetical protein ABIT16_09390 [Croceibacterium sp.]
MNNKLAILAPLLLAASVSACVTPLVQAPAAPEGSSVGINQPVVVGRLYATPEAVSEDSRCPENALCIWAGQLIVNTQIDGSGWRETTPLTLGVPYSTHGTSITLVSGLPEKRTDQETQPSDYRFAYQGGR